MYDNYSFNFKLLIVEDDPILREQLELFAEPLEKGNGIKYPINIKTAANYQEALELSKRTLFHIISIDQKIPKEKNGQAHSKYGLSLLKILPELHPSSCGMIYTGYPKVKYASKTKHPRYDYIEKWEKNSEKWVERIKKSANIYINNMYSIGTDILPTPIAKKVSLILIFSYI